MESRGGRGGCGAKAGLQRFFPEKKSCVGQPSDARPGAAPGWGSMRLGRTQAGVLSGRAKQEAVCASPGPCAGMPPTSARGSSRHIHSPSSPHLNIAVTHACPTNGMHAASKRSPSPSRRIAAGPRTDTREHIRPQEQHGPGRHCRWPAAVRSWQATQLRQGGTQRAAACSAGSVRAAQGHTEAAAAL